MSFSPEVGEALCTEIAEGGLGPKAACEKLGIAYRTFRSWLARHPEFEKQYDRAMRLRCDAMAEEALEIGDSADGGNAAAVQKARLQVDTRRWLLSKLLPERFGDRVELSGPNGRDLMQPEAQVPRLMQVLAVLMPDLPNSELHALSNRLVDKLSGPSPTLADGTPT